jgi:hypothetical protein
LCSDLLESAAIVQRSFSAEPPENTHYAAMQRCAAIFSALYARVRARKNVEEKYACIGSKDRCTSLHRCIPRQINNLDEKRSLHDRCTFEKIAAQRSPA